MSIRCDVSVNGGEPDRVEFMSIPTRGDLIDLNGARSVVNGVVHLTRTKRILLTCDPVGPPAPVEPKTPHSNSAEAPADAFKGPGRGRRGRSEPVAEEPTDLEDSKE